METFLGFFAGMGFAICVGITMIVCALMLGMEDNSPWTASITFIIALFGLAWMFDVSVLAAIKENPWHVLWAILGYFMIGVLWSIFKWVLTLTALKNAILAIKADSNNNFDQISVHQIHRKLSDKGCSWVSSAFDEKTGTLNIKNENVADKIISWIVIWPFSLINWMLNRFIQDLGRFLFNRFRNVYSNIATKIMEGV